ncbi:MAG: hypothetical protein RIS26_896 [Actinomycetota bacterium]
MKPTKLTTLVYIAIAIAIVGYFVDNQFVGLGLPAPTAGLNLIILLPSLALILVLSAIPMFRYRRDLKKFLDAKASRPRLVDSAYAVRTVALAKSFSLTGSIFLGWFAGLLVYQLTGTEQTRWIMTSIAILGSLTVIASGLVVEHLFRVPPDENGDAA